MSLSLSTADNQNNTGMLATVSGTDAGSANSIYASPVNQGNNNLAWTLVATRTGDGTVNLPVAAGYYFLYLYASAVGGNPAFAPPIIGLASVAQLAVQTQVELAMQARIQTLTLNGLANPPGNIPSSRVFRSDTPMSDELLPVFNPTPCVIVCPAVAAETVEGELTAKDDIGYPVNVLILALFAARQQGFADSVKLWRQQIFRALRFQRLVTASTVFTVKPEPQPILAWKPPEYQYVYSAITFRAISREQRGV